METKKCSKCKEIKTLDQFSKDKRAKDDLYLTCKLCVKKYSDKYYINNKTSILQKSINWRKNNLDKAKETRRKCYSRNKEKIIIQNKLWVKNNPDKVLKARKKHYDKTKENIQPKISTNISRLIRRSLKSSKNGNHWENIVNYTLQELMNHLEKQFVEGMIWDNYGVYGWHIDHIIPISFFQFTSYNDWEFKYCWSLTNLQPLWAKENRVKHNKVINRKGLSDLK